MARRKKPVIADDLLDQLLAGRDPEAVFRKDGLFDDLKRAVAERALNAEMDHRMAGEAGDGRPDSRNGCGRKTLLTETGKLDSLVPRDRHSTFDPQPIAKDRRRISGFDESDWGRKYQAIAMSWRRHWRAVIPFFAFPDDAESCGSPAFSGSSTRPTPSRP